MKEKPAPYRLVIGIWSTSLKKCVEAAKAGNSRDEIFRVLPGPFLLELDVSAPNYGVMRAAGVLPDFMRRLIGCWRHLGVDVSSNRTDILFFPGSILSKLHHH